MTYTIGGADLLTERPHTIVGEKRDDGVYLSLTARIKLLLACPAGSQPGTEVDADLIDEHLRQACARALYGLVIVPSIDMTCVVATACVQAFDNADWEDSHPMQATLRSDVYELPLEDHPAHSRADLLVEGDRLAEEMAAERREEGATIKETKIAANEKIVKVTVVYRPAA